MRSLRRIWGVDRGGNAGGGHRISRGGAAGKSMMKSLTGKGYEDEPATDCKSMRKRGKYRAGVPAGKFPCGKSRPAWPSSAGKDQGTNFQGPHQEWLRRNGQGGLILGKS